FQTAGFSDSEPVAGKIDKHVIVAQDGGRDVDLGLESGSDRSFTDRPDPSLFDPGSGNSSGQRDRHSADAHLQRRSGRAPLSFTKRRSDSEPRRHEKIGIPVVDPGENM